MKLERLHLKAFGGFDDHELNLSGGAHGLHLVYGPNEAGKSTTLRAITQLFYGIPRQTGDDYRHPMQSLRIGATVGNGKDSLTFLRRKGLKGTLLADDDKTKLDDTALAPFLGGVDEEAFTHLFGLSHEQLVRGGEALVQGEGNVGQALFSAAAGLGSLRAVLDRLEAEAGEIFKPGGSNPRINKSLKDLDVKRREIKDAQVLPKEWTEKSEELVERRGERDGLVEAVSGLVAEQSRLERIEKALPLVGQHKDVLRKLEELGDTVELPEDFRERRVAAAQGRAVAKEQQRVAEAGLARVNEQLDALDIDGDLLAREARIEALNGVHEVVCKALDDKQRKLEPARQQYQIDIARLLRDLHGDREAVEEFRPAPGVARHINELASNRQAIEKDETHAREQEAKLAVDRKAFLAALEELGDVPNGTALEMAIQGARTVAAAEEDMAERGLAVARLRKGIDDSLVRLAIPAAAREALETLTVPGARTIERVRVQMESEEGELRRCDEERRALEDERADIALRLDTFKRTQRVPTEATLMAERALREAAWQQARTAWEQGVGPDDVPEEELRALLEKGADTGVGEVNLADTVEAFTRRADDTADRLRRESDRAAAVAQLEARHGAVADKLAALAQSRNAIEVKQAETRSAWESLWRPLDLTPRSPAEMAEWHGDYAAVLADMARLREEEGALKSYAVRVEQHRGHLASAVADLGEEPATDGSLVRALAAAERHGDALREGAQRREQVRNQLEHAEASLAALEQTLNRVSSAWESWTAAWDDMMARIGARPGASTAEASARLEQLEELFDTLDRAAELEGRIAQIDGENEAYLEEVDDLAHVASATGTDQPRELLVPALFQALKIHRQRATEKAGLEEKRAEEEARLAASEAALERAEAELTDLVALACVASVTDLEHAESLSRQHAALQAERRSLETRLQDFSPGLGLADFLAMVEGEDAGQLSARLNAIGPEREEAESRRQSLSEQIGQLEKDLGEMDGRDTAAALAGDAESLLATVAEDAREYARLKVAHFVLNEAIERYRAANQEPLLARAGEIFATLTLGSFRELRADYDSKGNHVLCGFREGAETPVHVPGMSEGTADQLYLALRLASLERHLEKHPPIPFVLDDILVNFDDHRAAATLKVLGDLSARTQVIYFTHHAHLVDLAREHVAKKQLFTHELGGT